MRDIPLPTLALSDVLAPSSCWRSLHPGLPDSRNHPHTAEASRGATQYKTAWARQPHEVLEAQRLRHLVFAQELGARLSVPVGTPPGHDVDVFDPFCEHLLVRAHTGSEQENAVIGTYRVLTPDAARRAGGIYSDTEFDLTRLRSLRNSMVELGRSCVHPDWRTGGAIMALWGALTDFMVRNSLSTMVGCASVSMRDGGHAAASLWEKLRRQHLATAQWQVLPRLALPIEELRRDLEVDTPALIKGYLRCGAKVLGPPAWDPDFNTADFPMMMRISELSDRYRRHFLERSAVDR